VHALAKQKSWRSHSMASKPQIARRALLNKTRENDRLPYDPVGRIAGHLKQPVFVGEPYRLFCCRINGISTRSWHARR
ncbi:hypothetical protein, partial [Citrobacter sp. VF227]